MVFGKKKKDEQKIDFSDPNIAVQVPAPVITYPEGVDENGEPINVSGQIDESPRVFNSPFGGTTKTEPEEIQLIMRMELRLQDKHMMQEMLDGLHSIIKDYGKEVIINFSIEPEKAKNA